MKPPYGWLGHRWVCLAALWSKVHSFRQLMAASCAKLPTADAGQYATSNCKLLLFWFSCKRQYINILTFNSLTFNYCVR